MRVSSAVKSFVALHLVLFYSDSALPVDGIAGVIPTNCGPPTTVTVTAQPDYASGRFLRFLFGSDYRDLWTTPIEVEVLDLACVAGGLEPVRRVGQLQTLGLALRGADGKAYTFRGVDKDPTGNLDEALLNTAVAAIARDQTSADLPGASVIAVPLSTAAGALQNPPRLVVMPDDPRLGEFREDFAGVLGTFEAYPLPPDFGATEIIGGREMYDLLTRSADDRIDERETLRVRLIDQLMGDWDRHPTQWRWARIEGNPNWYPLPEDRDHAFSRYDGFAMMIARDLEPKFDVYGPRYTTLEGSTWNTRSVDRRLLSGLEWTVWSEVAREVHDAITDEVIEAAFGRMPPEYFALRGEELIADVKARRDGLPEEARRFYLFLAAQVNVYGTDEDDLIVIERGSDGSIQVAVSTSPPEITGCDDLESGSAVPFFDRRFLAGETSDLRIYTGAGDDVVIVKGKPAKRIKTHVVRGDGQLRLCDDRLSAGHVYEMMEGPQRGRGDKADAGLWIAPPEPIDVSGRPEPPGGTAAKARRDWGHTSYGVPWLGFDSNVGLLVGFGIAREQFGFRKRPYAARHQLRGGYAFGVNQPRFDYMGDFRAENRRRYWDVRALVSGIENLYFYGLGNDTEGSADDPFFQVRSDTAGSAARAVFELGDTVSVSGGPIARYTKTDQDHNSLVTVARPYGVENTSQIGVTAGFRFNNRTFPGSFDFHDSDDLRRWGPPSVGPGWSIDVDGHYYPEALGLEEAYGLVRGTATYAHWFSSTGPSVSVRVGSQQNWGTYPYFDAAHLGSSQVRGLPANRYAGDASVFGNLALYVRVGRAQLLVPGFWGFSVRGDVGRVFLSGEESNTWHWGAGAGLWWTPWLQSTRLSLSVARSDQDTRGYLLLGYGF